LDPPLSVNFVPIGTSSFLPPAISGLSGYFHSYITNFPKPTLFLKIFLYPRPSVYITFQGAKILLDFWLFSKIF